MLREQTTEALEQMKRVDPRTIGSFQRALVAGDGTRIFSKKLYLHHMNKSLLFICA